MCLCVGFEIMSLSYDNHWIRKGGSFSNGALLNSGGSLGKARLSRGLVPCTRVAALDYSGGSVALVTNLYQIQNGS